MLKFGYLYLNKGFWEGRSIIPTEYVADSIRQQNEGGWPINVPYGYMWWVVQYGQHHAFFASGLGGQRICVIPALDLVIATTASIELMYKNAWQENEIQAIIPRFILPGC